MKRLVVVVLLAGVVGLTYAADKKDDPPGLIDPRNAKLKKGGFWDGFWTRFPSKLTEDAEGNGVQHERNATYRSLAAIAGEDDADAFLKKGYIHFKIKINAAGLEAPGGGKHLINLNSSTGALGYRKNRGKMTRIEIANPGGRGRNPRPRFVLHNYRTIDGKREGGATVLGACPWKFEADKWVEVNWSWKLEGRKLTMEVNGRKYEATLLEGSEGPGRYWGPGHVETKSGGGEFTFSELKVAKEPPQAQK